LGFCLQYGLGVEIDLAQSVKYYKMSADQDHPGGAYHYALCLHYGIGVDQDLEEAARYYERAANPGEIAGSRHSFRIRRNSETYVWMFLIAASLRGHLSPKKIYRITSSRTGRVNMVQ
jgi:TPR repeat protein